MKGHNIETEFRNVIGKGKISARSSKRIKTKEPKEVKLTAYRMFMKTKRPEVRSLNPNASPAQMTVLLNNEWNQEKTIPGRKAFWQERADEENLVSTNTNQPLVQQIIPDTNEGTNENHVIVACDECGLRDPGAKNNKVLTENLCVMDIGCLVLRDSAVDFFVREKECNECNYYATHKSNLKTE